MPVSQQSLPPAHGIGGSLVFYRYLLSQCNDRDVLVLRSGAGTGGVRRIALIRSPPQPGGARRHGIPRPDAWPVPPTVPWLLLTIVRCRASVVHVGFWSTVVPTWAACRLSRRKLVITIHGEELTTDSDAVRGIPFRHMWRIYDRLARGALRGADLVHTNSRFTERVLLDRGVRQDRIRRDHPGIDIERPRAPGGSTP